jgi:hypothetical protein
MTPLAYAVPAADNLALNVKELTVPDDDGVAGEADLLSTEDDELLLYAVVYPNVAMS